MIYTDDLKKIRKELTLTQKEITNAIGGITIRMYQRWEGEGVTPSLKNQRKLTAAIEKLRQDKADKKGLYALKETTT